MSYDEDQNNVNKIINAVIENPSNPIKIRKVLDDALSKIMNGDVDNISSTNPLGYALESMVTLTAGFITYDHSLNRRQYPVSAQSYDDLYFHMCDKDYLDRFAKPSSSTFIFIMQVEELINSMVYDDVLKIHKVIIPRNTEINVGNISFTMEYPIEIRKLNHGGLQIIYDASITSPIQTLETNLVDWTFKKITDNDVLTDILLFEVKAFQTRIISCEYSCNASATLNENIKLSDNYYFARVYYQDNNENWIEMLTTHNPYIYNISKPTATLKLLDDELNVRIPQIYQTLNTTVSKIRVDVYQTKGELNVNLDSYSPSDIKIDFTATDKKRDLSIFTAPITKPLSSLKVVSSGKVTSGRNPISFEELKERVINNSVGQRTIPISPNQIEDELQDYGFKIVKNVDVVTNRIFYAARALGKPKNENLITAAASSVETIIVTVDELINTGKVANNGDSITILPGTIYENKKGIIKIVDSNFINKIKKLPPDNRVLELNQHHYYYTPFHYVLDMRNDALDLRAYYLDKPSIITKSFVGLNDTTLLQVSCDGYSIERTKYGYSIKITTKSSQSFQKLKDEDINVQLMFNPNNEKDLAYVNGKFIGYSSENKERIYQFDLITNYNLDDDDSLVFTNFKMYDKASRNLNIKLTSALYILFSTTAELDEQWKPNKLDEKLLGKFLLPDNSKAIICEQLDVTFGYALNSLWKQARSIVSTEEYAKYDEDVYAKYEKDVLEQDENGNSISIVDGEVVIKYLHRKGDTVYDKNNNPIVKYKKGDVILNSSGKPIIKNPRGVARQLDLMLVEAVYWFADDPVAVDYRQEMIDTFLSWMLNGLDDLNKRALEQTKIYFYPRATLGQIDIMYNNGTQSRINAAQSLVVDLVVKKNVFLNNDLRKKIEKSTIKTIDSLLSEGTISDSDIISNLKQIYSDDVIGIKLKGLGGNNEIIALSVLDESRRCSLKKRLVAQSDNSIMVEEDVTINFIKHDINDIKNK